MSLWQKPIGDITIQDVDVFCQTMQSESFTLDYKSDCPPDLEKTIAAFANTLGGLIILGVAANKTTNQPIWPPQPITPGRKGLPFEAGLAERVIQKSRDAIYPPLLPEVSNVLENPQIPGQAIMVIRVPQSIEAPHAVEQKLSVYIYDRTDNNNFAHKLTDIDHIEHLLKRRNALENKREEQLRLNIYRARNLIADVPYPLCWYSVIPYFPWRDICVPEKCFEFHPRSTICSFEDGQHAWQRMPGGSLCVTRGRIGPELPERLGPLACSTVVSNGCLFSAAVAVENINKNEQRCISVNRVAKMIQRICASAAAYYLEMANDYPGFVQVSVGVLNARGAWMYDEIKNERSGGNILSYFPDDHFRADATVPANALLDLTTTNALRKQVAFGFNMQEYVR